ncbi:MAG: hypothetical protein FWB75_06115 [Oscillospiraceae bacterium]|nr:hypothetical protein [Oscillospiraceae bacterium]
MKKLMATMLLAGFLVLLAGCNMDSYDATFEGGDGDGYTQEVQASQAQSVAPPAAPPTDPVRMENLVSHTDILSHQNGIPAWLLAGVEAYLSEDLTAADAASWYAQASSRGLPGLTDEWFIPGFIEDTLAAYAAAVAYTFVRHLSENNQLDSLISHYWRDVEPWYEAEQWSTAQAREAERMRAELWADFAGGEPSVQDVIFQYTFGDSMEITGRGIISVDFNALAQYGWYFYTASGWPRDVVMAYIESDEDSIRFVGDWLGYHHDDVLISVQKAPPYAPVAEFGSGGGRYWADYGWTRTIDTMAPVGSFLAPWVHVHEAVHALLYLAPHMEWSNIADVPPEFLFNWDSDWWNTFSQLAFEEGMCVLLTYLFMMDVGDAWWTRDFADMFIFPMLSRLDVDMAQAGDITIEEETIEAMARQMAMIEAYRQAGGFDSAEEFMAFADEFLMERYFPGGETIDVWAPPSQSRAPTREEIIKHLHMTAFLSLNGMHHQLFSHSYDFMGALQAGVPYAELMDHYTAASFFLYLLEERGTREDFLIVYQDVYAARDVFGYTLAEMVHQWRTHLGTLFDPWLAEREAFEAAEAEAFAAVAHLLPPELLKWDDTIFWTNYIDWMLEWISANT